MNQLSNSVTKKLEEFSTPMIMCMDPDETSFEWFAILGWTHNGRNITDTPLAVRVQMMATLLGFKQNYDVMYEGKHAVWGLVIPNVRFILYVSNLGLSVQLEKGASVEDASAVLSELYKRLIDK